MLGLDRVHKDLHLYHRLRTEWSIGPIKIKLAPCDWGDWCPEQPTRILHNNMLNRHSSIRGCNSYNKEWYFLGRNYEQAFRRIDYVKTTYVIPRMDR